MTPDWTAIIIAVVTGILSGSLTSYLTAKATAAQKVSEAAGNLAQHYDRKLQSLENQQRKYCRYIRYLLEVIRKLSDQVVSLGQQPCVTPQHMDELYPTDGDGM